MVSGASWGQPSFPRPASARMSLHAALAAAPLAAADDAACPAADAPLQAQQLEEKLRKINDDVPTRVFNVMGSCAGAGSGDFHHYRQVGACCTGSMGGVRPPHHCLATQRTLLGENPSRSMAVCWPDCRGAAHTPSPSNGHGK